jgi:hypothetical protein
MSWESGRARVKPKQDSSMEIHEQLHMSSFVNTRSKAVFCIVRTRWREVSHEL